jgi:hypothetical protein
VAGFLYDRARAAGAFYGGAVVMVIALIVAVTMHVEP